MNNLSSRLVVYLVGAAAIFVILFGVRGSASIINPILLAAVITITVLPVPSRLTKRGMRGWLALVLIIMENFEGTRPVAILMRYTGEEKKEERQEAAKDIKGLWGKVKGTFTSAQESKDVIE